MRVLDATVETVDAKSAERKIPVVEFHRLPGDKPEVDTVLKADELITSVTLPKPLGGAHVYRKVRDRASYAFAPVSVAAVVQPDGTGRVAFRGLAHKPWRVEEAEADLPRGPKAAADGILSGVKPTCENAFKLKLAERTLGAALNQVRT
jgi:xanthine dehydrogenase YagS FAD-binding subunit